MDSDFLVPVHPSLIDRIAQAHPLCLGKQVSFHTKEGGLPDLTEVKMAIVGVRENRREADTLRSDFDFDQIRDGLYALFPGNWHLKVADLGDILPGESVEDTAFALRETLDYLINKGVIPVILGGSQDLTYSQYRAYDSFGRMVNLVNVDARFDLGDTEAKITDTSYIGKMIVDKPYNLFNYTNLGYQSYLNPPDEIELIEKLYFEAYRLGELSGDLTLAEPVMRDADLVSIDYNAVSAPFSSSLKSRANGFDGREICTLSRYAGISDKVSSFGIYGLQNLKLGTDSLLLPSEILWYFIEGVNFRKNEGQIPAADKFIKYSVPIDNEVLTFFKSKLSGRWWIEIPSLDNNKLNTLSFLPCTHKDYIEACDQEIPQRWYKARKKNEL